MSKRIEFLSSREYWEVQISTILWNKGFASDKKCDKIAKTIVTDQFMKDIKELANQAR